MLSVTSLNDFCAAAVADIDGLNHYIMIVGEKHLASRMSALKPGQSPFLVALYPSADSLGSSFDDLQFRNELDFFILKKIGSYSGRTHEEELADYDQTQKLTEAFLKFIDVNKSSTNYCTWLGKVDANNISIDPEYSYYASDGWSFSFTLNTT